MADFDKDRRPARWVAELPFPPYSYVPRAFPHPSRDAGGHSRHRVEKAAAPLDPRAWRDCREYLFGIDLFNHGYYWEAHEAWEGVWIAVGRRGEVAEFLKALIKLAAAGVKAREDRVEGVRRALVRAAGILKDFEMHDCFCGIGIGALLHRIAEMQEAEIQGLGDPHTELGLALPMA